VINELEISCLPKYLPEFIEVDVSGLELEANLPLSEVVLPEGVAIVGGEEMLEQPVVIIHRPRREEEPGEEAEGEGEAGGQESFEPESDED
jgi:large subunit ribosomal protein L25